MTQPDPTAEKVSASLPVRPVSCLADKDYGEGIATCLLFYGHAGPHFDYGNGVRWHGADGLGDDEALGVYCMTCSAAVGTPCSNPMLGGLTPPHAARFALAARA